MRRSGARGRFLVMVAAAAAVAVSACARQGGGHYPDHPVHVVVGYGAGGPDTTARLLTAALTAQTGQRFLVDNKPGSSGVIGAEFVAKAPADGYTLLVAAASLAALPSLQKNLPFDVNTAFTPVSEVSSSEAAFLVVSPSVPVKNLQEFMAWARDPNNKASYASTGIGTGSHLRGALFAQKSGLPMQHVPYKAPGEAAVSVMGGEAKAVFMTTTEALPLIKSGKVRALAYDYPTRAQFLPDIPTMAEAGAAPTELEPGWHGVFAPSGTPRPIVEWLETEIRKAVATEDMQTRIKSLGLIPVGNSSAEFGVVFGRTIRSMGDAARAAGIQPQ